ncbi:MAG: hypothetical protein V1913_14595 [Fibrobacterota bacterium]
MLKKELNNKSPLRILENTTQGGLGKGNLGVFAARHGVGKTACLVHFALDALLQGKKVLHLSFAENAEHILSWYESLFTELKKAYKLESAADIHDEIEAHRLILNFTDRHLSYDTFKNKVKTFIGSLSFAPELIIVDGYDFEKADKEQIGHFKQLAVEMDAEIWVSFPLHGKDIVARKPNTLPAPLDRFNGLFSVVILLDSEKERVMLRLLRDHDRECVEDTHLRLNPTTLLLHENS